MKFLLFSAFIICLYSQCTAQFGINCGPEQTDKFQQAVLQTTSCLSNLSHNATFCDLQSESIPNCLKPTVAALSQCVPNAYNSLPQFFNDVLFAFLGHTCTTRGREFAELLNPCVDSEDEKYLSKMGKVVNDFSASIQQNQGVFSKEIICKYLKTFLTTWQSHVEAVCYNSLTIRAWKGFERAFKTVCAA